MRLLLDTHALLWFLAGDKRLSHDAREAIESAANTLVFSDGSLWEIAIKQSMGKLTLAEPFESKLVSLLRENAVEALPIERSHVFGVARLPFHHRDPFDRLIIATARVEGLPILTNDSRFLDYEVETVW